MVNFTKDQIYYINSTLFDDLQKLRDLSLMDYSLLVIIVNFPKEHEEEYQTIIDILADPNYSKRIFISNNKKYIYCMGIIDYLQKFNLSKFFENKYKSIVYGNEIKYVSAVDPTIYSNRMLEFLREFLLINK